MVLPLEKILFIRGILVMDRGMQAELRAQKIIIRVGVGFG